MRTPIVFALLLSASYWPAWASPTVIKVTTTSIEQKDCLKIKGSEFDSLSTEKEYEYNEFECTGLGGYQVFTSGKDLRYTLSLKVKGTKLEFATPSELHDLGGSNIEWRYEHNINEAIEMKALIYQLQTLNEETLKSSTSYYVIRLSEEKSCLIGKISEIEGIDRARKLADDSKAKCL